MQWCDVAAHPNALRSHRTERILVSPSNPSLSPALDTPETVQMDIVEVHELTLLTHRPERREFHGYQVEMNRDYGPTKAAFRSRGGASNFINRYYQQEVWIPHFQRTLHTGYQHYAGWVFQLENTRISRYEAEQYRGQIMPRGWHYDIENQEYIIHPEPEHCDFMFYWPELYHALAKQSAVALFDFIQKYSGEETVLFSNEDLFASAMDRMCWDGDFRAPLNATL